MDADLAECSIAARFLAPGLWMLADREGRLKDQPKQIKMEVLPCEDVNIDSLLWELAKARHILRYATDDGHNYIQIRNFLAHQRPHKNEPTSDIPEYSESLHKIREPFQARDITRGLDPLPEDSGHYPRARADLLIPDLLNADLLIPDSKDPGVSIDTLSGNLPDAVPEEIQPPPEKADPPAPSGRKEPNIPYGEIIGYLNKCSGKAFKASSSETKRFINARWKDGFRLADFVAVIDRKCSTWLNDPRFVDFLRPQTLFGTKFEGYLNEARAAPKIPAGMVSDVTRRTIANLEDWSPPDERCSKVQG